MTSRILPSFLFLLLAASVGFPGIRADLSEVEDAYRKGRYQEAIRKSEEGREAEPFRVEWSLWIARCREAIGQPDQALSALADAMRRHERSLRIRLEGHRVAKESGRAQVADELLAEIHYLANRQIRRMDEEDPYDWLTIGWTAHLLDNDPKAILQDFYEKARDLDPKCREAYVLAGKLALEKHDYQLASEWYQSALREFPDEPDFLVGLANAFFPGDRATALELVQTALEVNERHVPALLLMADHLFDAEAYDRLERTLEEIREVNPRTPEAWAYRAALAHLRNEPEAEKEFREKALETWPSNPEVDHLIGRKLSQKYRFAEGSTHQKRALAFDPRHLPAQLQLSQDLLRLGREEEGWALAESVSRRDPYDVRAFNLLELRDKLRSFTSLTNERFTVRMDPREAEIYGERVMDLLGRAHDEFVDRYGVELEEPTLIEIFPDSRDFAVRTFGMPHNPGFLGVCFGRVITANSPASQTGLAASWESVLWHEFCHVVTLTLTRNKMPRWLSEGISVYEERRANPTWGQQMELAFRRRIVDGETTPVEDLSAVFMNAETDEDMQFAYYQSSLVVEFLVETYGFPALRDLLKGLRGGGEINAVLEETVAPLSEIETGFQEFARTRAEAVAPELDFRPVRSLVGDLGPEQILRDFPDNYYVLMEQADQLMEAQRWLEAREILERLIDDFPENRETENPYLWLARACRESNDPTREREVLERFVELRSDIPEAFLRLAEIATDSGNWDRVERYAEGYLAMNPLVARPFELLALAHRRRDRPDAALGALRQVLKLDPTDPAQVHFDMARLLARREDPDARRHVLLALENAPRFREAHRLLLRLIRRENPDLDSDPEVDDGDDFVF